MSKLKAMAHGVIKTQVKPFLAIFHHGKEIVTSTRTRE